MEEWKTYFIFIFFFLLLLFLGFSVAVDLFFKYSTACHQQQKQQPFRYDRRLVPFPLQKRPFFRPTRLKRALQLPSRFSYSPSMLLCISIQFSLSISLSFVRSFTRMYVRTFCFYRRVGGYAVCRSNSIGVGKTPRRARATLLPLKGRVKV